MTQTPPYQVTDPATGAVTETFRFATDAEVAEALAAATEAFAAWRLRPVAERAAVVKRIAELFTERAADLAALITKEMGKRPAQGVGEAEFCTAIFDYYADNGPALISDKPLPGHDTARVEYRPVGPVLGVMPWNYPYYQVARFAAPNLIVGNTVILKHAENCPTSALAIAQIMKDAGVPDGAYVNLFATHEQVAAMIADPRLRGVSLTGSGGATVVAGTAGRNLKKVVLDSAGPTPTSSSTPPTSRRRRRPRGPPGWRTSARPRNSNKRMNVIDDVYDDFVAALVKRAAAMTPRPAGDDSDEAYSPMVSRKAAENLLAQVQERGSKGATLHVGGTLDDGKGAAPAVLTGVTPEIAGLPRGAVRPGRRRLQGERRRRSRSASPMWWTSALAVWSADEEQVAEQFGGRHGQRQHPGRRGRGPAVRRHQALQFRPRAKPRRRIRQQAPLLRREVAPGRQCPDVAPRATPGGRRLRRSAALPRWPGVPLIAAPRRWSCRRSRFRGRAVFIPPMSRWRATHSRAPAGSRPA